MNRRQVLQAFLTLSSFPVAMSGCGRDEPIHVGVSPWPGYAPLLLARHFGWFGDAVILTEGKSASDAIVGLKAGTLSAACLTLDEVLSVRSSGLALTVILVMDESVGADVVLVRPDIRTLADLKGKRIAMEDGAVGALVLLKLLSASGLTKADLTLVEASPSDQLPLWKSGQIDAAISYPPFSAMLENAGGRRLYDSSQFPHTIFDVLAVRRDQLTMHESNLRSLVAGYLRALEHLRDSREDALRRIGAWRGTSFEATAASYRGLHLPGAAENRTLLAPNGDLMRVARTLNTLMLNGGLLTSPDELSGLTTTGFLPDSN